MTLINASQIERIDAISKDWRQGDFVIDQNLAIVHFANAKIPLTEQSYEASQNSTQDEEFGWTEIISEITGLVVLTQTCDIVKTCRTHQFIEVAPLIKANDDREYNEIRLGMRPRYVAIPGCENNRLVAQLDRVMTLEKAVMHTWERQTGCQTDDQRRKLAAALARKYIRPAFPDDFVIGFRNLTSRWKDKYVKDSAEGEILRSLREIRVTATPDWNAESVNLTIWFIKENLGELKAQDWGQFVDSWISRLNLPSRFVLDDPPYRIRKLEDMTAQEYDDSDRLDLDHLSDRV